MKVLFFFFLFLKFTDLVNLYNLCTTLQNTLAKWYLHTDININKWR